MGLKRCWPPERTVHRGWAKAPRTEAWNTCRKQCGECMQPPPGDAGKTVAKELRRRKTRLRQSSDDRCCVACLLWIVSCG